MGIAAETKRTAQFRKTMTVAEQALYTGISGNMHPLYVNAVHASKATGGERLVFELAAASLITTALADLGGPDRRIGAINLRFTAPIRVGDTVEGSAEIASSPGDALHCSIRCALDDGTTVAEGSAELVPVARPRG